MHMTDLLRIFLHAMKSMASTTFACGTPFLMFPMLGYFTCPFVFCHSESGNRQGLSSHYSEDTKSVIKAADPEGLGTLLGRSSMSLNNLI